MRPKKSKALIGVGLTLFSLPFAGVGVFMAVLLVRGLLAQNEMKAWRSVPATIEASELETHRGDDSTTYKASARYTYSFDDHDYTGTRVGLSTGGDNFGSYQQDWGAKLKQHRVSGEPIPVFIDPNNPSDAILDRDLRVSMLLFHGLFALVFGGVGFGLLFGGFLGGKKAKQISALEAQYPDEPWKWRADWASGQLESDTRAGVWVSIGFATFWNLVSSPVLFVLGDELAKGNHLILIALLFPLVGLGLIVWAIRSVLVYRRYGRTVLHLAEVPGVIGGRLTGAIKLNTRLEPEDGFELIFSCVRITVTGSGKHRTTQRHILWEEQASVPSGNPGDPFSTYIPVVFEIPYENTDSDSRNDSNKVVWELEVKADVPGVDYSATFEVPVFRTPQSDPQFKPKTESRRFVSPDALAVAIEQAKLRLTRLGGTDMELFFPAARHKGTAAGLTLFTFVWTAVSVGTFFSEAPRLFPIVFGASSMILWISILNSWGRSRRVTIRNRTLQLRSALFGVGQTRELLAADCDRFERVAGMTSGNKSYYGVVLYTLDEKKIKVGSGILDRDLAQKLSQVLNTAVGRPSDRDETME